MKVLFIGGTGLISSACAELAIARGLQVTLLNRSLRQSVPGAATLQADIHDRGAVARAIEGKNWDVVVDFIAYKPEELVTRLDLFRGKTGQYMFISSASVYQKPLSHYLITESTPLVNPFWQYSRDKIACEEVLMRAFRDDGYPVTIVRPSHTYGDAMLPLAINSGKARYTAIDRMRRGLPLIVPGDGATLWTLTHNSDFAKGLVGLIGNLAAIGHAFHITSDEALTWDQVYREVAAAAGVDSPRLVHIASDFLSACLPELSGNLLGDKSRTALFDNSKIRRFVPDFVATTGFRQGIQRTVAWHDADPARREIDREAGATWDRLIAGYERGLAATQAEFK